MDDAKSRRKGLRPHAYLGLAIILAAEILMFSRLEPVLTFFTPIVWTGYILLVDGIIYHIQGRSMISDRFGEFLLMFFLSLVFWLIFEFYNLFIKNWHYQGLPENPVVRGIGYIWAFSTILPAILLTARLAELLGIQSWSVARVSISRRTHWLLIVLGALCLIVPPALPLSAARYLMTPIWLGFIFLLDPINHLRGGWSLLGDWQRGDLGRLLSLFAAGLMCGILWEFWNYWAKTKWIYAVPLPLGPKIFEMPLGGYLGFLPFAVECHVMYVFVMTLRRRSWFPLREI